MAVMDKG